MSHNTTLKNKPSMTVGSCTKSKSQTKSCCQFITSHQTTKNNM